MIKKNIQLAFLFSCTAFFTELNAFSIRPGAVMVEAGKEVTVTLTAQDPKEYMEYRIVIDQGASDVLSFHDTSGKEIKSIILTPGSSEFKIKAISGKTGDLIIAFDSRPVGQEYTGQLIYARQGLSVTVIPPRSKL